MSEKKTAKTEKKEEKKPVIENAAVNKKMLEVVFLKTYCGAYGVFAAGKKATLAENVAEAFIKSGDAKRC